jgi:hypothetical protein
MKMDLLTCSWCHSPYLNVRRQGLANDVCNSSEDGPGFIIGRGVIKIHQVSKNATVLVANQGLWSSNWRVLGEQIWGDELTSWRRSRVVTRGRANSGLGALAAAWDSSLGLWVGDIQGVRPLGL